MKVYKKAVLPSGFKAGAACSGIKRSGKLDLALFYSDTPAKASCLFTANKIIAAPLKVSKDRLKENRLFKALIVNSGNANCFTGKAGIKDAQDTCRELAKALKIGQRSVLVNSTGIIARRLPVAKIKKAIPALVNNLSGAGINRAQKAIMTTDTFPKAITVKFSQGAQTITLCGIAKGAGMIAPQMATMLCFIFTDADISAAALKNSLKLCADNSFNCITVDGCMSTNDSIMLLANGRARNATIKNGAALALFVKALHTVCLELAKMVVRDAEGASKFIRIDVRRAKSIAQARKAALCIANSNLFKTAMYGENPNFGRIVAALGSSGIGLKEKGLKIKASSLKKKDIEVLVLLGQGNAAARVYTSDLTPEYIKINAAYN